MSDSCQNCAKLAGELARAKREGQELRRAVRRLRRVIALARAACAQWLAQTQGVLSKRSGVPRGTWAFALGAHEVARRMLAILNSGGET